ncbi:Oxidoreductase [Rhodococcus sp. RD6.2]|jgi:3-hydroxy-9,10-secoandrosta-1,3,5(10)-triene-9,17-dione monooxygenase reductase component|uniref:flavin reductase family protein n=1 Tax=unclassified Rhodococcus (in: high G+C Gram-positive bacteria) TaxID=192944 RepID=UPI00063B38F0|nr:MULTISPECIES: flavin reductase family protein [unclassified Rhodococcus (in: high G+C Gram-positive bacteria)]CRK53782.1 Oxidoreductase [Rhodococcus sp. RD6.2]
MSAEPTLADHVELSGPDAATLRQVMGHFCTGVAVITAHDGERPLGFTCQSVVSLSLEPPFVSFCPTKTSTSWPLLREARHLCINVLAHDQKAIASGFARSGADKFAGVSWSPAPNGAPALDGTLARIDATLEVEHDAGDHTIVIARITDLTADIERQPLLFFKGGFGDFAAH